MWIQRAWRRLIYRLYLRTPHWARIRRRALERHGAFCHTCGAEHGIQVHHTRYRDEQGRSILWRERTGDLIPLCGKCHKGKHA